MNFDLIKTFKVTDECHTLGLASGVDGATAYVSSTPTVLLDTTSSTGATIVPKTLRMWLVGTAPAAETAIYIVGDTKVRYVSGGGAATVASPSFSRDGRPAANANVSVYSAKNGSAITALASTTAELIDTVTLVGGTAGVGFSYQFEDDVALQDGCSLLVYAVAATAPKMKFSLWYKEEN